MLTIELTHDDVPASAPGGAVYELALSLGIASQRVSRIRVMVDELVNLAQQREHGDKPVEVKVRAWSENGHLVVEVIDRGIPIFTDDAMVPHELVRLGFAEHIEVRSHGSEGNIARCSVALTDHDDRAHLADSEEVLGQDAPEVHEQSETVLREMRPEDCGDLARLVYRCYGYNYPFEDMYHPSRMAPLVERGLMHSAVIVDAEGVLIGHAALSKSSVDARIAEAGKLVVDPRYRSHGLAQKMAAWRLQKASELELLGTWTECVSNHSYSQRNQLKLGARETGFFLGMIPPGMAMVGLDGDTENRGSLVPMYLPLRHESVRTLHLPSRYRAMITRILSEVELKREFSERTVVPETSTRLNVSIVRGPNVAVVTVEAVGHDLLEELERHMEHLQDMRIAAIYLDLPLSAPGTAHFGDHLAGFGFFFSALLPESVPDGDVLRLQFLNHEHPRADQIKLASSWGEELLTLCLEDMERVLAHLREQRISD